MHQTSLQEINDLRAVVERDISDAGITALSADRRFATAYNAALQLAKICIACAGYRVSGPAHHQTSFQALVVALGPTASGLAAYFEVCRRRRNTVDYDSAYLTSETEAQEVVEEAKRFQAMTEAWISLNHPHIEAAST